MTIDLHTSLRQRPFPLLPWNKLADFFRKNLK